MEGIMMSARAKINLSLDVVGKRADGYHDLRTIMQTLELSDMLTIRKVYKPNYFKCVTNVKFLPTDGRNLVVIAAKALMERYEIPTGIFIKLDKQIPVSAGLAGGSADAAACLKGLVKLFDLPVSDAELMEIGAKIGADVPFCLTGGTCLCEGKGEIITPLSPHPPVYIVLVRPHVHVSTPDVFKRLKLDAIQTRPDITAQISAIEARDILGIASQFGNVLESVTAADYPIIEELKQLMREMGALNAVMSGSGPTVFGYFERKESCRACLERVKQLYPNIKEYRMTSIRN